MVLRLPAHELTTIEQEECILRAEEAKEVMDSWCEHGGVMLEDKGGWVGIEDAPS